MLSLCQLSSPILSGQGASNYRTALPAAFQVIDWSTRAQPNRSMLTNTCREDPQSQAASPLPFRGRSIQQHRGSCRRARLYEHTRRVPVRTALLRVLPCNILPYSGTRDLSPALPSPPLPQQAVGIAAPLPRSAAKMTGLIDASRAHVLVLGAPQSGWAAVVVSDCGAKTTPQGLPRPRVTLSFAGRSLSGSSVSKSAADGRGRQGDAKARAR